MERETISTPIHGGLVTAALDKWTWLRSTLSFCPDPTSYPPRDISGWCHKPFEPTALTATLPTQGANGYGPAVVVPSTGGGWVGEFSKGWVWHPLDNATVGNDSNHIWGDWTLAIGFQRLVYHANDAIIAHLYSSVGSAQWRLFMEPDGAVNWSFKNNEKLLSTAAGCGDPDVPGPTQSIVVTNRFGRETSIYCNGRLEASAAWGDLLVRWDYFCAGADIGVKDNAVMAGAYGPVILSRSAWTAGQVAQWAAQPWGFRAPAWVPQLPLYSELVCDVQTRAAVATDAQTRAAVEADVQTRVAVMTDALARAGVVCDAAMRAAVVADAQARAAVAGDTQTRAAVIADAQARAAVFADAQARAAVAADVETRAAVSGDAQTRSAVGADVQTTED